MPDGFESELGGVEIACIEEDEYVSGGEYKPVRHENRYFEGRSNQRRPVNLMDIYYPIR